MLHFLYSDTKTDTVQYICAIYCVCARWVCLYEGADLLAAGKDAGLAEKLWV